MKDLVGSLVKKFDLQLIEGLTTIEVESYSKKFNEVDVTLVVNELIGNFTLLITNYKSNIVSEITFTNESDLKESQIEEIIKQAIDGAKLIMIF